MTTLTPAELKARVEATGSNYFSRSSMSFFGDTMRNYGVRSATVETWSEGTQEVWELYRRHPVKHGIQDSAFFACDTFQRIHPKR